MVQALATWPAGDAHTCRIDDVTCVLAGGTPWDRQAFRLQHPSFPSTSVTLEQHDEVRAARRPGPAGPAPRPG